jgi:hypothetical protein
MAVPVLTSVAPATGLATGGELVRLLATGLSPTVSVLFGRTAGVVLAVHSEGGHDVVDVRTPATAAGAVDVIVDNLDATGRPVPGERALITNAYTFTRPDLRVEADLARVVRTLMRLIKDQVLEELHLSVSIDYAEPNSDGVLVTALATLPSLVLSGPVLRDNALYTDRVNGTETVPGLTADDIVVRRPSQAFDLSFQIAGASDRAIELLNLMAAVARFLDRNRWLEVERVHGRPELGLVRLELEADGGTRMRAGGQDGVHVFTGGLVVRGVPLVDGPALERTRLLTDISL